MEFLKMMNASSALKILLSLHNEKNLRNSKKISQNIAAELEQEFPSMCASTQNSSSHPIPYPNMGKELNVDLINKPFSTTKMFKFYGESFPKDIMRQNYSFTEPDTLWKETVGHTELVACKA